MNRRGVGVLLKKKKRELTHSACSSLQTKKKKKKKKMLKDVKEKLHSVNNSLCFFYHQICMNYLQWLGQIKKYVC